MALAYNTTSRKKTMNMDIAFTKMHGLGNDFVVIDAYTRPLHLSTQQIQALAHRHLGVGFDQLLMVERPITPEADFRYRIFNADGSEVEQCGNGARCFVKFVHQQQLTDKKTIAVETAGGLIFPSLQADGLVSVDMGIPVFTPNKIPFLASSEALRYQIQLPDQRVEFSVVSMGNPHALIQVEDITLAKVNEIGSQLESHQQFPNRVNVGFMQVIDSHHLHLRVFERGAGETMACGTGACAAAVIGIRQGLLQNPVTVHMRGGDLQIAWAGEQQSVIMTGPAVSVFHGVISLN